MDRLIYERKLACESSNVRHDQLIHHHYFIVSCDIFPLRAIVYYYHFRGIWHYKALDASAVCFSVVILWHILMMTIHILCCCNLIITTSPHVTVISTNSMSLNITWPNSKFVLRICMMHTDYNIAMVCYIIMMSHDH